MELKKASAPRDALFAEARELEALLANLKRGISRDLQAEEWAAESVNQASRRPSLTSEQRREKANSSWAKSGSKRHLPGKTIASPASGIPSASPSMSSVELVRKRTASYTISKAKRDDAFLGPKPTAADVGFYDPHVDAASTTKRARNVVFTTTKRPSFGAASSSSSSSLQPVMMVTDDDGSGEEGEKAGGGSRGNDDDDDDDNGNDSDENVGNKNGARKVSSAAASGLKWLEKQPPAFSFGKAVRVGMVAEARDEGSGVSGPGPAGSTLDVARAQRYLETNVPGAIIRPPSFVPPEPDERFMGGNDGAEAAAEAKSSSSSTQALAPRVDVLSTHTRAPTAKMHPPTAPSAVLQNKTTMFGSAPGPGPGTYNVELAKPGLALAATSGSKGRIYRAPSKLNHAQALMAGERAETLPGVGDYDVQKADKLTRKSAPVAVTMHPPASDVPLTLQQQRKKYWEDKAAGLQEDHDEMRETSLALVRPRTPSVTTIAKPPTTLDWRSRMVLRERALEERRQADAREAHDVERALTALEPARPKSAPLFSRQVAAAASTRKRITDKPSVQAVLDEKREAERRRDKFYGPQLQVAWGEFPQGAGPEGADNDSGDESPTEDLNRLLSRSNNAGAGAGAGESERDTTAAYLRSSLAAPTARAAVIMRPPPEPQSRAALCRDPEPEPQFLGPQLPVDWTAATAARDQSHKNRAILMDAQIGRKSVRVRQKGEVQVLEFGDGRWQTDPMGPGYYDPALPGDDIADGAKGAVPFAMLAAREDALGPDGERPTAYLGDIADVAGEAWLAKEFMDLDYGDAKDRKVNKTTRKGISLYGKERHAAPKALMDPADYRAAEAARAHVGGEWFRGMAAEQRDKAQAGGGGVDMAKMKGRSLAEAELEELMDEVTGLQPEGPTLLQVKDWNPSMTRPVPAPVFKDAEKFPRFPPDPKTDPEGVEHLGGSYFQGMSEALAKKPAAVNMSRPSPDPDSGSDRAALNAMLDGEVDIDAALALAHERAAAVRRGIELTNPKLKKTPFMAGMDKQRGRDEPKKREKEQGEIEAAAAAAAEREAQQSLAPSFGQRVKGGAAQWNKVQGGAALSAQEEEKIAAEEMRREGLVTGPQQPGPRDRQVERILLTKGLRGRKDKADSEISAPPIEAQRSPRDSTVNSRFKAPTHAVSWSKQADNPEKVAARPRPKSKDTPDPGPALTPRGTHFVDPDAGAFKGGGSAPLGAGGRSQGRGGVGGSASSLANELREEAIMRDILAEALGGEVDVGDPFAAKSASSSSSSSSGAAVTGGGRQALKSTDKGDGSKVGKATGRAGAEAAADGEGEGEGERGLVRAASKVKFADDATRVSGAGAGAGAGLRAGPLSPMAAPVLSAPQLSASEPPEPRAAFGASSLRRGVGEGGEVSLSAAFRELDARLGEGQGQGQGN